MGVNEYICSMKEGCFNKDAAIMAGKNKIRVGDVLKEGVVTGIYPSFFNVKPFGKTGSKLESILWIDYYRKSNGIKDVRDMGGYEKKRYGI